MRTPVRILPPPPPRDAALTPTPPWRELYDSILADATSHRTMTPLHPQWNLFLDALWAMLGGSRAEVSRTCPGRGAAQPVPVTTFLLNQSTLQCDLAGSLLALMTLGGYCDCTILWNTADATPADFPPIVEMALRIWSGEEVAR